MRKNILITGGNSGIGREMTRTLAGRGHRVIIASRDQQRSLDAIREMVQFDMTADIEAMPLDLASLADIRRFADELLERMPRIDVLILNAGLYTHGLRRLDNGLEAMIGVMHFGHFLLTRLLLDGLRGSAAARVVVTSSVAHRLGSIQPASFRQPERLRLALRGYAQAKLANLLFARELSERLWDDGITVNAFHPGAVSTGIWQEMPNSLMRVIQLALITVEEGADTGIWLADSPEVKGISGKYFVERRETRSSRRGRDWQLASELWQVTERTLAELEG